LKEKNGLLSGACNLVKIMATMYNYWKVL